MAQQPVHPCRSPARPVRRQYCFSGSTPALNPDGPSVGAGVAGIIASVLGITNNPNSSPVAVAATSGTSKPQPDIQNSDEARVGANTDELAGHASTLVVASPHSSAVATPDGGIAENPPISQDTATTPHTNTVQVSPVPSGDTANNGTANAPFGDFTAPSSPGLTSSSLSTDPANSGVEVQTANIGTEVVIPLQLVAFFLVGLVCMI